MFNKIHSQTWLKYFISNQKTPQQIDWYLPDNLSAEQQAVIQQSLQAFQRVEYSEGKNLLHFAKQYAAEQQDEDYVSAIVLFIREEQRHAHLLATYMKKWGIPTVKHHFLDNAFRGLRRRFNLRFSIRVLQAAEMTAEVYYTALSRSTSSVLLKTICADILQDERAHLRFHAEQLVIMDWEKGVLGRLSGNLLQKLLFYPTILVIWLGYADTFRAGGYDFSRYIAHCQWVLYQGLNYMNAYYAQLDKPLEKLAF
ncbi:ferritin-like domain-containing protein [Beggiatoa leptomitoformis]|uniref:Ferritin-like domain-containing protein n=1 Tax=Beggiatoa leptomitoformis TaxID=288004 RepID=A0A2N9YJB0_9GAMM|nr:ferritin-like domain-containing protein [Beggiatoa leptomitoformis]ALG67477.1 hypothetical protein AL038_06860 [Beggiatoa leptomitoformis]AUI70306.1 hypothetical protein BLE401_17445 [Beggiatoa leptomitoformis]